MKTVLIITRYQLDGKPESFARAYLPTEEASAEEQCSDFWFDRELIHDPGTEITHTPSAPSGVAPVLRQSFPHPLNRARATARLCGLLAVENGAPAIPEGTDFWAWLEGKDALPGDYELLAEVCGASSVLAYGSDFRDAYLETVFDASPTGPAIEEEDHEENCARTAPQSSRAKGCVHVVRVGPPVCEPLGADEARDGHDKSGEEIAQAILEAVRLWAPDAWSELAANMDSYGMSNPGKPQHCRPAYYAAYKSAANQRAAEILAEAEAAVKGEAAQ